MIQGSIDAVHGIALLKNAYQLLLNQQSATAAAVGRAALREAQRLGLSGQVMQIKAISDQFSAGRGGIVLPPAQFQHRADEGEEVGSV